MTETHTHTPYRGTLELRGQAEKYEADLRLAADARQALCTGQLVPVQQPSVDEVEAVAKAIRRAELGDFSDEEVAQAVVDGSWGHKMPAATAAITAYKTLRAKDTRP